MYILGKTGSQSAKCAVNNSCASLLLRTRLKFSRARLAQSEHLVNQIVLKTRKFSLVNTEDIIQFLYLQFNHRTWIISGSLENKSLLPFLATSQPPSCPRPQLSSLVSAEFKKVGPWVPVQQSSTLQLPHEASTSGYFLRGLKRNSKVVHFTETNHNRRDWPDFGCKSRIPILARSGQENPEFSRTISQGSSQFFLQFTEHF